MGGVGEALQSARVAKRLSLNRVEQDTRIRLDYLEALEAGHYERLPAPAYARAYIRTYAQYLGLDPAPLVAMFNEECKVSEPRGVVPETKLRGGGPEVTPGPFIAISLVVLVAVLGFYLYQQYDQFVAGLPFPRFAEGVPTATATAQATQVAAARPTRTPTPSPTATPTPVPTGVKVDVRIIQRCWFQVAVDGTPVYTGTLEAGDSRTWTGKDKIAMRAGNPNGVEISVNGKPWERLAPYGSPPQNYEWTPSQR